MERILLIILLTPYIVFSQITLIPDQNFEQALIDLSIDNDGVINGQVATADVENVINLIVSNNNISDLTGIEDFVSLEYLSCRYNNIESLNVSNNLQLKVLNCSQNNLSVLDISNNLLLEELYCGNPEFDVEPQNTITEIDLSNNLLLRKFNCVFLFNLDALDLSNNIALETLEAYFCNLSNLDLSNNSLLEVLDLGIYIGFLLPIPSNNLQDLDLSNNPNLSFLGLDNTTVSELNLRNGNNTVLTQMYAIENPNLYCIEVDDEVAANNNDFPYSLWDVDAQISYAEDCTLGVSNLTSLNLSIYPNPVKNTLQVIVTNGLLKKVIVYNTIGKQVLSQIGDTNSIDVSQLKTGVYFIKVETNNGVLVKKVIKS